MSTPTFGRADLHVHPVGNGGRTFADLAAAILAGETAVEGRAYRLRDLLPGRR